MSLSVMAGLLLTAPATQAGDTSYSYDALGRVIQVTFPDGSSTAYQYDSAGNRLQVTRTTIAPTAGAVSMSVAYNGSGTAALLPDGNWTSLAIVTPSSNGTASISGTTVTFVPNTGFHGSTSFTYRAVGPGGNSTPATVSVTVATPAAPTVSNVALTTAYNTAGTATLTPTGAWTGLSVVSQSSNGTATISGTTASFTPTAGFHGNTSFTYRATGPGGNSAPATVNVTVNAPAAPTVSNATLTAAYNMPGSVTLAPGGVYTSLAVVTQSSNGTATISGTTATFTPNAGFIGTTSFTYRAIGPGGNSSPATVNVTVNAPAVPTAGNVSLSTAYNTAGSVALAPGGSYTSLAVVTQSSNGMATINGTTATFTPNAGFHGATSFTYRAVGPGGNSAPATVTVNVAAPPAPTVSNRTLNTSYNTAGSVALAPGGVYTSLAVVTQSPNGTATISGTTATFTPNAGFSGTTSFTYRATGPGGNSAPATVTVNVAAPPAPTAGNVSLTTAFNTAGTVTLTPGGVYTSLAVVTQSSNGTATISGTTATFTPNAGFSGTTSFTYRAAGPGGNSAAATVSVTVQAPPVITLNVTGRANLRTLANNNGYTGNATARYQFVVPTGTTIMGASGGGNAIETGTWPAGVTLTLVINGNVYGGGGTGGRGKCQWETHTNLNGGNGGNGVNVSTPITITVNGTLRGGGGGGGGSDVVWDDIYSFCGGGGGGGAPNGGGGAPDGSTGSVTAGGAAGQGEVSSYNWSTGGAGGALANDGEYPISWAGGGDGGAAGLSVKANGHAVTINGSGSY
ncbi:beta strand repeat-containing protein [Asticcacaulis tiandongensis]|uniref:beta strand repeat-containing protein n=1 Tax=Asticcacaulis tiandongensis TaxID=2565365 RepID=UPI0011282DE3|nr:Ig-like domain-containing protein [Asticcacaulis tiandongensis]